MLNANLLCLRLTDSRRQMNKDLLCFLCAFWFHLLTSNVCVDRKAHVPRLYKVMKHHDGITLRMWPQQACK